MQLMLFRHGIAEETDHIKADADRALTGKGRKRTQAAAQGVARVYDPPQRILTSPKTRARQTAEIVGETFARDIDTWHVLARGEPADIREALGDCEEASLMLVGHEPTFSQLIELLCYGRIYEQTNLKKAGCGVLDAPVGLNDRGGPAVLQALLPPSALVEVAGTK